MKKVSIHKPSLRIFEYTNGVEDHPTFDVVSISDAKYKTFIESDEMVFLHDNELKNAFEIIDILKG